jgi:hypothetical protein
VTHFGDEALLSPVLGEGGQMIRDRRLCLQLGEDVILIDDLAYALGPASGNFSLK